MDGLYTVLYGKLDSSCGQHDLKWSVSLSSSYVVVASWNIDCANKWDMGVLCGDNVLMLVCEGGIPSKIGLEKYPQISSLSIEEVVYESHDNNNCQLTILGSCVGSVYLKIIVLCRKENTAIECSLTHVETLNLAVVSDFGLDRSIDSTHSLPCCDSLYAFTLKQNDEAKDSQLIIGYHAQFGGVMLTGRRILHIPCIIVLL